MGIEYFIRESSGTIKGPVSEGYVKEALADGSVTDDMNIRQGDSSWVSAIHARKVFRALHEQGWFVQTDDEIQGPFVPTKLRDLIRAGEISKDRWIRKGEHGEWMRVADVEGKSCPPEHPPTQADKAKPENPQTASPSASRPKSAATAPTLARENTLAVSEDVQSIGPPPLPIPPPITAEAFKQIHPQRDVDIDEIQTADRLAEDKSSAPLWFKANRFLTGRNQMLWGGGSLVLLVVCSVTLIASLSDHDDSSNTSPPRQNVKNTNPEKKLSPLLVITSPQKVENEISEQNEKIVAKPKTVLQSLVSNQERIAVRDYLLAFKKIIEDPYHPGDWSRLFLSESTFRQMNDRAVRIRALKTLSDNHRVRRFTLKIAEMLESYEKNFRQDLNATRGDFLEQITKTILTGEDQWGMEFGKNNAERAMRRRAELFMQIKVLRNEWSNLQKTLDNTAPDIYWPFPSNIVQDIPDTVVPFPARKITPKAYSGSQYGQAIPVKRVEHGTNINALLSQNNKNLAFRFRVPALTTFSVHVSQPHAAIITLATSSKQYDEFTESEKMTPLWRLPPNKEASKKFFGGPGYYYLTVDSWRGVLDEPLEVRVRLETEDADQIQDNLRKKFVGRLIIDRRANDFDAVLVMDLQAKLVSGTMSWRRHNTDTRIRGKISSDGDVWIAKFKDIAYSGRRGSAKVILGGEYSLKIGMRSEGLNLSGSYSLKGRKGSVVLHEVQERLDEKVP